MSDRFEQANALIDESRRKYQEVEIAYNNSLSKKNVDISLQVGIKGIIDNLRSALDYIAYELAEKCCSVSSNTNVYFPIAKKDAKEEDFKSLVGRNIPGLLDNRPVFVDLLESFQPFKSKDNDWLPNLATLSAENKHKNLSPQTRNEKKELRMQSLGVAVSIGDGATVSIGRGAAIGIGAMTIPGGQILQPGSPVRYVGPGTVETIIWVSFEFSDIHEPVLPFLKRAIDGVSTVVEKIRSKVLV